VVRLCKKREVAELKTLDKKTFEEIRAWIYRNARPIDLAEWQYEFESGSKDAVVSALLCYQNEDGGFGNALEPDNWNPNSTPIATGYAISKLNTVNFTDLTNTII